MPRWRVAVRGGAMPRKVITRSRLTRSRHGGGARGGVRLVDRLHLPARARAKDAHERIVLGAPPAIVRVVLPCSKCSKRSRC